MYKASASLRQSNVLDICRCQIIETCGHKNHFFFLLQCHFLCCVCFFSRVSCCCYSFTVRLLHLYFPCSFVPDCYEPSSPPTKSFAPQFDDLFLCYRQIHHTLNQHQYIRQILYVCNEMILLSGGHCHCHLRFTFALLCALNLSMLFGSIILHISLQIINFLNLIFFTCSRSK